MEVHPPEHPIHTPRDFFIHLLTITVGLLIALSLEGLVEVVHHRHLLHTAENNLRVEIHNNQAALSHDEQQLDGIEQEVNTNIGLLTAIKSRQSVTQPLGFRWQWNGMQSAAWDTARETGAVALMDYNHAQEYSIIYGQQGVVNDQFTVFIRDFYRSGALSRHGRSLTSLQPAGLDSLTANAQQALSELAYLHDLCHSLDLIYNKADQQR